MEPDIVLFQHLGIASGEVSHNISAVRCEYSRTESAAFKLAVHHQMAQYILTHLAEADDHGLKIAGCAAGFIKIHVIAGRKLPDQCARRQTGFLHDGHAAVAILIIQRLQ